MTDLWPACGDQEPGTKDGSCVLRRGHPGSHRSDTGTWGDDARRLEDAAARDVRQTEAWAALRVAVAGVYVNHVGQEGRGAAASVRDNVLRLIDEHDPTTTAALLASEPDRA